MEFKIIARGKGTLRYQWIKDEEDILGTNYKGHKLHIRKAHPRDEGSYRCKVSNEAGEVESCNAQLEVGK